MHPAQVPLPTFDAGLPAYYVLALSEASSNLARYDGVRYGLRSGSRGSNGGGPEAPTAAAAAADLRDMYNSTRGEGLGPEVKRRILMGTYALSAGYYDAYYKRAQQVGGGGWGTRSPGARARAQRWGGGGGGLGRSIGHPRTTPCLYPAPAPPCYAHQAPTSLLPLRPPQVRKLVQAEMEGALAGFDALLSPTAPTPAYKLGEKLSDPLAMYKGDLMTVNLNLSGLPAIVVPCGVAAAAGGGPSLPVGLQFVGRMNGEAGLCQLAHVFEQTSSFMDGAAPQV